MRSAARAFIFTVLAAGVSFAATTATWELNGYQDFLRGRMSGLRDGRRGRLGAERDAFGTATLVERLHDRIRGWGACAAGDLLGHVKGGLNILVKPVPLGVAVGELAKRLDPPPATDRERNDRTQRKLLEMVTLELFLFHGILNG